MKNVWEQKREQEGVKPTASIGEGLVMWVGSVFVATVIVVVLQLGLSFVFDMHAAGLLQLVPWLVLSVGGVVVAAEGWEKKAPIWVYVLAGVSTTVIHFTGFIS